MKPKEIQELLDFIANSGLAEVNIETENLKLAVKKHAAEMPRAAENHFHHQGMPQPSITQAIPQSHQSSTNAEPIREDKQEKPTETTKDKGYITIKSPMIGTFYRSSNPETPSLINVGDEIIPGKPLCIIEAMKLFNEIESEISGTIIKVLVDNSSPVEYDQPLFLVEPK